MRPLVPHVAPTSLNRARRAAASIALGVAWLAVPSAAHAAQTTALSPTGQLGPEGASATVTVIYSCDPPASFPFMDVTVSQSTGKRLTQYAGSIVTGLVCDSAEHTVLVTAFARFQTNLFPLKQGDAAATARLVVSSPVGPQTVTSAGPQVVRLRR